MSRGFNTKRSRDMEGARFTSYMIYCANVEAKNRVPITKFMPLATDEPETEQEDLNAVRARVIKMHKEMYGDRYKIEK